MGELTINKIDAELLEELKSDAERHGVSPEERAATIISDALGKPEFKTERAREAYQIASMAGRKSTIDSTDLIREDRSR